MKNKTKLFIAGLAALSLIGGVTATAVNVAFETSISQTRAAIVAAATLTFPAETQTSVSNYTSTMTATNSDGTTWTLVGFNNNKNGWSLVKCGNKSAASVNTISTALTDAITSVEVTANAVGNVTACYLEVSTDASFPEASTEKISVTLAAGKNTFTIRTPTASANYRITIACSQASANDPVQISKLVYYKEVQSSAPITAIAKPTLSKATVNLAEGDALTGYTASAVTTPAEPDEDMTWSSSNEDVATISSTGAITIVGTGTCTFTAHNSSKTISSDPSDTFTVIGHTEPDVIGTTDARLSVGQLLANTDGNGAKKMIATGVIKSFGSKGLTTDPADKFGNMTITDGTNDVIVYGATAKASALAFDPIKGKYIFTNPQTFLTTNATKDLKIGDRVNIEAIRCDYTDTKTDPATVTKEISAIITGSVTEELTSVTATLAKNSFTQGDALTADDFSSIVANYVVAGAKNISFADVTVSPERFTESGPQNVTVTYQGVTSAPIAVNVASAEIAITGIELNKTSHTLMGVGDTVKLIPTISPANATEKGKWIIEEGEDYVSIDEETGVVTATKVGGSATVFYYNDGENIGASCTIDVHEAIKASRTDALTREFTEVEDGSTTYVAWTDKTFGGSVYAGNSAGSNDSIQLRSNNDSSGVIVTESAGFAKKVTLAFHENSVSGRFIDIYGSHSAYSDPASLYVAATQGDLLGSIEVGAASAELVIEGDYEFIGLRSRKDAIYVSSISIDWKIEGDGADATALDGFMKDKLHMSANVEGQCTGYYADAKAGYAALNRKQKVLLANSTYCTDAYARLVAWAAANGETIDSKTLVLGANRIDSFLSDDSNGIALASIALMGGLVAGGAMLLRKKKEEK